MPRRFWYLIMNCRSPRDSLRRINSADAPGLQMGLQQIMRLFGHEAHHFSAGCSLKLNDAVITAPFSPDPAHALSWASPRQTENYSPICINHLQLITCQKF
ncbi:hypothetical protein CDAR_269561 [Caerostris darwini]|uniref:Uncharacterized protein n=1 Tax=Caerostris darwini TaxID=1538125 RepID=A0AAV4WNA8_9ARAC|nr:hypothetical protein CDAR_269561 [Caerostris darwini]